jgi:glycosyltransferase involved in cell wall biosynthesis
MNVSWLTACNFGQDLCGTTQVELSLGLVENGIDLTMYAPGIFPDDRVVHVPLSRSRIKGRQSASLVKSLIPYLEEINQSDVVLLDWKLSKLIPKIRTKLILIDRGPPADRGMLSFLQWSVWKRGWKMVSRGCVVSESHRQFVETSIPSKQREITILPAGVNTQRFHKSIRKGPIRLVYQGQIDFHRGIEAMLEMFQSLDQTEHGFELYLHGKGDMVETIRNMKLNHIYITEHLPQDELAQRLAGYDIGLLPMPPSKVWKLASPLKRSEYLGAGLLILGILHEGHELEGETPDNFNYLFPEDQFLTSAKGWLESLQRKDMESHQNKARLYAVKHLDWSHSVERLLEIITS